MSEFNPSESRQTNGGQSQVPVQSVEKPTSVTVFGVLNIVFGGLGILCTPFGILMMLVGDKMAAMNQTTIAMTPNYKIFSLISSIIGIGFSAWLLTLGIGLVTMKRWARRGSVIYACIAIVWCVAGMILSILALNFGWISVTEGVLPGFVGGMCGGLCGGLIYPVLLLIFMQTAKVKQAFSAVGG